MPKLSVQLEILLLPNEFIIHVTVICLYVVIPIIIFFILCVCVWGGGGGGGDTKFIN